MLKFGIHFPSNDEDFKAMPSFPVNVSAYFFAWFSASRPTAMDGRLNSINRCRLSTVAARSRSAGRQHPSRCKSFCIIFDDSLKLLIAGHEACIECPKPTDCSAKRCASASPWFSDQQRVVEVVKEFCPPLGLLSNERQVR